MSAAHLRPLPSDPGALVRYRCPEDDGTAPARHLAFDARLPVLVQAFRHLPTRCICGAGLHHWMAERPAPWPAQTDGGAP
jgi:hypothetical protein